VKRLDVPPLNAEELAVLAEHLTSHGHESMPAGERLVELVRGSPAHVQQLARYIVEGGELENAPDTQPDLIAARKDLLSQEARVLLQAAATVGREVPREVLAQIVSDQLSAEEFEGAVAILRARGFLIDDGTLIGFESGLTRDVTYDATPADVRRALHAATAEALEEGMPGPLILGHHLELAGKLERASDLLTRAGDDAVHQFDDVGASMMFHRALAATRQLMLGDDDNELRSRFVSLSVKLGETLRVGGEVALARGIVTEARGYCDDAPGLQAQLLRASAHLSLTAGDTEGAIALSREAIGLAIPTGKTELLCDLYIDLSSMHLRNSDPAAARQELEEGLDMITLGEGARAEGGPPSLWRLLLRLAQLHSSDDEVSHAISIARHALEHARRASSRVGLARVQSMLATEFEKIGNETQAESYRQAAVEEMRKLGDRRGTAELLLAGSAPTRSLVRITSASLREAEKLAAEVGWREGADRARSS
jgi:hypothetical protein